MEHRIANFDYPKEQAHTAAVYGHAIDILPAEWHCEVAMYASIISYYQP